jgi:multidrug efflux pump subunit AcrB
MFPAVLTATATTIFAFLPILMMSGEVGKFMQILPIMVVILLLSSLLEAFFFLPLHAKQLFKLNDKQRTSQRIWDVNKQIYKTILDTILKHRFKSLMILVVSIFVATFTLMKISKFQFMPTFDTTQVYITGSIGVGHKIEQTEQKVYEIEKLILKEIDFNTDISSISSVTGMKLNGKNQPENEEFYFHIFIDLHERAPINLFDKYINPYLSLEYDDTNMIRYKSAQEIEKEIKKVLESKVQSGEFEELKVFSLKAGIVKHDIEIALSKNSDEVIKASVLKLQEALKSIQGVSNVAHDILEGNEELKLKVNAYGQELGMNEEAILNALRPYYLKASYSKMFDDKGIVEIVFQSKNKDIAKSLEFFEIEVPNGTQKVLLKEVVTFVKRPSYSQIFKQNNTRIQTVTASLSHITSAEVYEKLEPTLNELRSMVQIDIKGEQEENVKVQKEMSQAFLIALILIFIALIWMFDSIAKSLIILSTIPLSVLGVYIGHFIMGMNITMPTLIGIVGLAGVVVNDGIIMMDFIKKSKNLEEVKTYALLRLRPILLTSVTTVLGLFTLMFFASGQALLLQPLAVALGFGVLWATILNLYYVPLLYSIVYKRKLHI